MRLNLPLHTNFTGQFCQDLVHYLLLPGYLQLVPELLPLFFLPARQTSFTLGNWSTKHSSLCFKNSTIVRPDMETWRLGVDLVSVSPVILL